MDEQQPDTDSTSNEADEDGALTEDLVAYLDGELGLDGNEAVEARIGLDPTVRAEADALKKTWDLLDYLPRPEPSPNFTERTLSKLEPIRPMGTSSSPSATALSGSATSPQAGRTSISSMPVPRPRSPRQKLLSAFTWALIVAGAGFGGYLVRDQIVRMDKHELDAKILSEQRLLQNAQRFRYVDDLAFLQALDNPELFGEEPYVSASEVPK